MTRTSRIPLYKQLVMIGVAIAIVAPSFPVQAQHYRQGHGYRRPPPPRHYDRRGGGGGNGGAIIAGALLGVVAGAAHSQLPTLVRHNHLRAWFTRKRPRQPPPGVVYYDNGPLERVLNATSRLFQAVVDLHS